MEGSHDPWTKGALLNSMFPAQSPWSRRVHGNVTFIVNVMMVAICMKCGVLVSNVKILLISGDESGHNYKFFYSKIPASLSRRVQRKPEVPVI